MKKNLLIISALLFMLIMPIANSECIYPKKNFKVPDGSKATETSMIEVQTKIKAYQADSETYRTCLETELASIPKEDENYAELDSLVTKKYNASVEEETQLAEDWGTAVRAFKSQ